MANIKYNCKNCGWGDEIREEWADLKPKRCMNKKCNTSFVKNPEALETVMPVKEEPVEQPAPRNQRRQNRGD